MSTLLAVDSSTLIYKACHVNHALTWQGIFTGGFYGYIKQVCSAINDTKADKLVLTFDWSPYFRAAQYKTLSGTDLYKKDRQPDPLLQERVSSTKDLIRQFVDYLQLPSIGIHGYECDDWMGMLAHSNQYQQVVMQSSDSDLYQLLNKDKVVMYKGSGKFYSENYLLNEFKVTPSQWLTVISLCGSHNAIPQVRPKLGPVTAIKLVLGTMPWNLTEEEERKLKINITVNSLPHRTLRGADISEFCNPNWTYKRWALVRFLDKLGIQTDPYMDEAFSRISTR